MKDRTETEYNLMKRSCFDKKYKRYRSCGKIGITVHLSWMNFDNFYKDMGDCPINKRLWRKDISDDYFKENCCWATKKEIKLIRKNSL